MSKRYKIVNTTIKAPRPHPKTGVDQRSQVEKVGHNVSFRLDNNDRVEVERHRPRIVAHVNEGMLRLRKGGYIRIDPIDDVTEILQKHTLGNKKADLFEPDEGVKSSLDDIAEVSHPAAERRVAKAVQMGEDSHEQKSGKEVEGAINPDGDPNFVVKADKNMKRQKRFTKEDSEADVPTA